jgi:GNAT superfamily N-acetyltransferase
MISISASTKEKIKQFNEKEWVYADTKYYGKPIDWFEKDFVFKADENGEIIGSISGKVEEGVLHIADVIVAKSKRGQGIGKLLIETAEKFAKENNAHKSYLLTGKGWPTETFYLKLGYKKVGELLNHFVHRDFVIYEKLI